MSPREQPDVVSSSPEYARRFAGEWGRYLLQRQNRLVLECLPADPSLSVLDVGGGHGQLLEIYTQNGLKPTIFASDKCCVEHLDRGKLQCVVGDFLNLPFADRGFDFIICIRQLSHLKNWRLALEELCRVADRAVIFSYPALFSVNLVTPIFFKLKRSIEKDTRNYTLFQHRTISRALVKAGYRVGSRHGQFLLPFVLHRMFKASALLRGLESLFLATGLTDLAGSPVILLAVRESVGR